LLSAWAFWFYNDLPLWNEIQRLDDPWRGCDLENGSSRDNSFSLGVAWGMKDYWEWPLMDFMARGHDEIGILVLSALHIRIGCLVKMKSTTTVTNIEDLDPRLRDYC